MSDSSGRQKSDFDYAVYHRTGLKIRKDRSKERSPVMDITKQAINIYSDVEDFFDSFEIENLNELEDVEKYVDGIRSLKQEFRRIHSHLKKSDEDNFSTTYPDYLKKLELLKTNMKVASDKLTTIKNDEKLKRDQIDQKRANLEQERLRRELEAIDFQYAEKRSQCISQRKLFVEQVEYMLKDFDDCFDVEFISHMLCSLESQLKEFTSVRSNYEGVLGSTEVASLGFDVADSKLTASIRAHIESGRARIGILKHNEAIAQARAVEAVEVKRRLEAESAEKIKISNILQCAENLKLEIKTRNDTILDKCLIRVRKLTDHEVLDWKKREDNIQSELRELIDKISAFEKFVLPCGSLATTMRDEVIVMRDECIVASQNFIKELDDVILARDISEKKLKNAAGLNIKLSKFSGYSSELDIYTFRDEFKKLIEPNVQKCLWADYLKKNYLSGAALNLVSKEDSITEIWQKLIQVYGDTHLMLQNKLSALDKFSNLDRIKDDEKISSTLSSLLNAMKDLVKIATEYHLENELYYGGGLHRILNLMGTTRERKFVKSISTAGTLAGRDKWVKLMEFLTAELKEREAYILNEKVKQSMTLDKKSDKNDGGGKKKPDPPGAHVSGHEGHMAGKPTCSICGKSENHVSTPGKDGKPCIEYVACKTFVDFPTVEREKVLFKKKLCNKCLSPGKKFNSEHVCDKTYICNQDFVNKDGQWAKCQRHVLVCKFHNEVAHNKELLELYKTKMLTGKPFSDFSKAIKISCFVETFKSDSEGSRLVDSIYQFQTIDASGRKVNIFYDNGCSDAIVSKKLIDNLTSVGLATLMKPGPITLNGVNNQTSVTKHGVYIVKLPLENGSAAEFEALCLDDITVPFPLYPLEKVEEDFRHAIATSEDPLERVLLETLPRLPPVVGGEVHLMIGKAYLKYFPKEIARLESGLTLYESVFKNPDGSRGVICGPHPEFSKVHRSAHFVHHQRITFLSRAARLYNEQVTMVSNARIEELKPEIKSEKDLVSVLHEKDHGDIVQCNRCEEFEAFASRKPKSLKEFELVESSCTDISYRCVDCRKCVKCKGGPVTEAISIQQELEQDLIDKSVTVDTERKYAEASLPFICDPATKLTPNHNSARKLYESQVKRLAKTPSDRKDTVDSEAKLQELGFVDYLENLDEDDRKLVLDSPVKYYIPWHVVYSKSISTPVRIVFNCSHKTPGGWSINDCLASGICSLNNLVEILIRWTSHEWAYHTDVRKMYNAVHLTKAHWCYQLYYWQEDLDPNKEPKIKVIKTLIYGSRASGQLAERALRLTAEKNIEKYPVAHDIIKNDMYMDDTASGNASEMAGLCDTDQLTRSLASGNFSLKGFTVSGKDPDPTLSGGKDYVLVAGLKWFPKSDRIALNINELNFNKKFKGRKSLSESGIPDDLTLKDCAGKVGELYDPIGRIAPIVAGLKLDVSNLQRSGLSWNDTIPDNLRGMWESNFDMINELKQVTYRRAVIPPDAKNLQMETLDMADASMKLICAAIYARFEKRDGSFSCQLIFARSKILPEGTTTPRGELLAAELNAATGFTVKRALGDRHTRAWKFSDSMVALHWIHCEKNVLDTFVRNRHISINRLCNKEDWRYTDTKEMVADIGTRKGAGIPDIDENSRWNNGSKAMSGPMQEFPMKTIDEIKLDQKDLFEANKEKVIVQSFYNLNDLGFNENVDKQILLRYQFSRYLIDPNKYRFKKVNRIMGLVLTFVEKLFKKKGKTPKSKIFSHKCFEALPKHFRFDGDRYLVTSGLRDITGFPYCVGGMVIELTEEMIMFALNYFFLKTSLEVKHFLKKNKYENFTKESEGILYYSGRILSDYSFDGYPELCEAAIDLCETTFCVPVMDQYSPVAIAIAMEIHWQHPDVQHTGIESMLRQTLSVTHIIGGRHLTKSVKRICTRCRLLYKNRIDVVMGPLQGVNLCIAPAFYASQIDIFGPYKSYSSANKRATIKVWFLVYCCCTTGAVDIRLLEDYSTDSFVQSFIRFSCRFGYPKYLLPDPGSQLVKGCQEMNYSFIDSKQKLCVEYGTQYMVCPVGAHYVHGKVERKIKQIKKCVEINIHNERLSVMQWETLMAQISNSINNLPIGLKNKVEDLENIDLLTPNRLILGRNNERSPNAPLTFTGDPKGTIERNAAIFRAWFKAWLVSYVPSIIDRPKWHKSSNSEIHVGDVVLFLKSEKEFDENYQYGIVKTVHRGEDGHIRKVDVEYQNSNENTKRITQRGVRDLVIVHPADELDVYERLSKMYNS